MKSLPRRPLLTAAAAILVAGLPAAALAGGFLYAGDGNPNHIVTHPMGYTGQGGELVVSVGILPGSPFAPEMEPGVRNAITTWNRRTAVERNLEYGSIPWEAIDFETVVLHELGHALGLGHCNLGSESGLPYEDRDYTRTTMGANQGYDLGIGADGARGTNDDYRGDDQNLTWFRRGVNNPFAESTEPADRTTFTQDAGGLPAGDTFVANPNREWSSFVLGHNLAEAVMQQGTFYGETQHHLSMDDVNTLAIAESGLDGQAGTGDDYSVRYVFAGYTPGADVTVAFDDSRTSFAVTKTRSTSMSGPNRRLTSVNVFFNTAFNWHFSTHLLNTEAPFALRVGDVYGITAGESTTLPVAVISDPDQPAETLRVSIGEQPPGITLSAVNDAGTVRVSADAGPGVPDGAYTATLVLEDEDLRRTEMPFEVLIANCDIDVPPVQTVPATGGEFTVGVTASSETCRWNAEETEDWISGLSASVTEGSGTVTFTASPNTGPERLGFIFIAGRSHLVVQETGCSISAPDVVPVTPEGGMVSIPVTVNGTGCTWDAGAEEDWLGTPEPQSITASGTVTLTVQPNTTRSQRTGTVTIGDRTVTVLQATDNPASDLFVIY